MDGDALVLNLLHTLLQQQGFAVWLTPGDAAAVDPKRPGRKPKGRRVPFPSTAEKLAEKDRVRMDSASYPVIQCATGEAPSERQPL